MKNLKFYVDKSGVKLARIFVNGVPSAIHNTFLCDALEGDFQSTDSCELYLGALKKIALGKEEVAIWSGNAYEITARASGVKFENLHTEEIGGEIPLHELVFSLACWGEFLEGPSEEGLEKSIPDNLDMVRAVVLDTILSWTSKEWRTGS
ncbi:hypothetical protein ACJJIF_18275 [Microbulbifer sp. SSSA002]|uniref:hypothetical protein n=1 Tax=Microbulbifer sp. SSSA002 TaxID=3243376 RepID=UPI0040391EA1